MSEKNGEKPKRVRRPRNFTEALHLSTERFVEEVKSMSKEELAERLTTYEPGVPHFWFGRPVEPITKEELLAYWNGGPEPPIRYTDVPQAEGELAVTESK